MNFFFLMECRSFQVWTHSYGTYSICIVCDVFHAMRMVTARMCDYSSIHATAQRFHVCIVVVVASTYHSILSYDVLMSNWACAISRICHIVCYIVTWKLIVWLSNNMVYCSCFFLYFSYIDTMSKWLCDFFIYVQFSYVKLNKQNHVDVTYK